ncbi:MAG: hypothetical protein JXR48_18115 [Candidatus Delongbacteria bacterium]|nr:hypothetical protein [Candidatus Delongbacteria bacterium]
MLKQLQLKDLFIGKIDAKNEIIENSIKEKERFQDSYLIPDNIFLDSYYRGIKYIISGLKGTGKTALLQYLALSAEKEFYANTSFILFKSEFTEDDKKDFSRAINTTFADKAELSSIDEDFVDIWEWFFHRHLVKMISKTSPFIDNQDFEKYKSCVLAPKIDNDESGISRFLPKLKRGNVELEGDFEFLKGKLGLDFEWINKGKKQVKFSSIVKQADELFKKMKPSKARFYIFIDELELTLGKQKQYDKDIRLIRDLLIAISKINNLCRKNGYPIFFLTAIRSEVLTSISASGKELNKIVSDFGVTLNWHQAGGSIYNHPLLKIINKKIQASEKDLDMEITESIQELWEKYFTKNYQNKPIHEYILHQTWYRPRDIVRMLSIAQQQFPYETKFSHTVFDAIRKEYSVQSWVEHAEELRAKHTEEEIEGIKKLFYGTECPFTLHEITMVSDQKRKMYTEVDNLLEKYRLGDILSILYKIGIIGNTGERVRYAFRGDDDILLDKKMKIHDPLWNFLSIEYNDNNIESNK